MARRPSTFRQSDVERAVKAARSSGLTVASIEVTPNGTIRVIVEAAEGESRSAVSPFDEWKAGKNASAVERYQQGKQASR